MIKGIIFDLDGTLLNTISDLGEACNRTLKEYGRETYPLSAYNRFVGNGMKTLIDRAFKHEVKGEMLDQALIDFKRNYHQVFLNSSLPYPQVESSLYSLQQQNIQLAVCTNKNHDYVKPLLDQYLGQINFIGVLGEKGDGRHKPDPYGPLLLAKQMNLNADEIMFVGDSDVDIQTAKNAGMISCGVSWGFRGQEELKKEGADYVVDHPSQWLEIIRTS